MCSCHSLLVQKWLFIPTPKVAGSAAWATGSTTSPLLPLPGPLPKGYLNGNISSVDIAYIDDIVSQLFKLARCNTQTSQQTLSMQLKAIKAKRMKDSVMLAQTKEMV